MSGEFALVVEAAAAAPPAEVLRGFTQETMLRDWLCDAASLSARPGGHLFLSWNDGQTVTAAYEQLAAPERVQLSWLASNLPGPSRVEVSVQAEGEGARLRLAHSSPEDSPAWQAARPELEQFWQAALENLVSVLETGIDLRLARRPRLGIYMDELTPEKARSLGAPVDQGVLLSGTVEGSGAHKAGLQKEDVLVRFNGAELKDPQRISAAIRGLKAGDAPTVEYYRGPELRRAALELGSFPIPDIPAEAEALAAAVADQDDKLMEALRAQLEGVGEAQASKAPAEGEWSVLELLAHFVLTERDYQTWAANMLNDAAVEDWLQMSPNVTARIRALTGRIPRLADMLEELAQAKAETAAMIAAFPPEFASRRKHLYRRAGQWALEVTPGHYHDEHREQIQAALEAARGS